MKGFSPKQQSELAKKYIPLDKPFSERDYQGYIKAKKVEEATKWVIKEYGETLKKLGE